MTAFSFLTRPRLPRNAFAIDSRDITAVELKRRGGRFALAAAASEALPPGLCVPQFDGVNIPNLPALVESINRVIYSAGLGGRQRWSVLLPEEAVKTLFVPLDALPTSREELAHVIAGKTERLVRVPTSELRISQQLVTAGRSPRFLVVAIRKSVEAEYAALFAALGWKVGVLVPRYVGEAAWLDWDGMHGDKLLVGARGSECTTAIVRGGELIFVRQLDGDPSRFDDEVYRLALYYRDRIAEAPERAALTTVLACGPIDGERVAQVIGSALGEAPHAVKLVPDLLTIDGAVAQSASLAAATGIASQAWAR